MNPHLAHWYYQGDRVKVDDAGQHHLATVIKQDDPWTVWVLLDGGDNPLWFKPDEVEPA